MAKSTIKRNAMRFVFYAAAAAVGGLLAVATIKKKGKDVQEKSKKLMKEASEVVKKATLRLNARQRMILKLFKSRKKLTNDEISEVVKGVTRRTLRRDLTNLEKKGHIKKVGKTKGSYYVKK
jgi:predicted HTH transcriptional regulator